MKRDLQGCRVLLTGASSGIGRAMASELARAGTEQILVARRAERLEVTAEVVRQLGGRAHVVPGDVTDPEVRQKAMDAARDLGGLEVLINNAGAGATRRFDESDEAGLRQIFEVNFFALVEMTRAALPLLRAARSAMVVNIGSVVGLRSVPHMSEYAAAKAAVHSFSDALRAELAADGIDVLLVAPGTTSTEFFDAQLSCGTNPAWPSHKPVSAEYVASQTVGAIRAGKHRLVPYGPAKMLDRLHRLSPRLVDALMPRYAAGRDGDSSRS